MEFILNLLIIVIDQLMLFAINIIVAREVGETLFGNYSVATNGLLMLATMFTLGIDAIIAYYVPKLYSRKKYHEITVLTASIRAFLKPIYTSIIAIGLLTGLTIIALAIAIKNLNLFEIHHPLFMFLWGIIGIALYNILVPLFRSINYMRTAVILSLIQTLLYFVFSLIIYFYVYKVFFKGNVNYFPHTMLIGFVLSYFLTAVFSFMVLKKANWTKQDVHSDVEQYKWKEKIYGYTIQNLNSYIFTTIPLMAIEWLGHNEHSVGLFAAVISIISLAFIGISPIGILIGPEISAAIGLGKKALKQTMKKYLAICFIIALLIVTVFSYFAEDILFFYKGNFIDALPYLYICLFNILTYAVSMPLNRMIQYSEKGNIVGAKLTAIFLSLQVVVSVVLTVCFGIAGTVAAYMGINTIYNLTMAYIAKGIYQSIDNDAV